MHVGRRSTQGVMYGAKQEGVTKAEQVSHQPTEIVHGGFSEGREVVSHEKNSRAACIEASNGIER